MRIGLFSDVHGHLDELNKTLALLELLKVDELLCLGDLVDKGAHSDAVVDLMRERAIQCVQGNHDAKAQFTWLSHGEPLKDRSLVYLSNLPTSLSFEWAGVSVFACHSNPWHDTSTYIYPTGPSVLFKFVAEATDASVIILGHTHHPMRVRVGAKIILNPGSIYGNRNQKERTCGVLSLPERHFELYDIGTGKKLAV